MKKILLFWLLCLSALTLQAQGDGYLRIYFADGNTDSIASEVIRSITQSHYAQNGTYHNDFVAMVINTNDGQQRTFDFSSLDKVILPNGQPWQTLKLVPVAMLTTNNNPRRVHFHGTYPSKDPTVFTWEGKENIYVHMAEQDTIYQVPLDEITTSDSLWANFKTVSVRAIQEPVVVYYNGMNPRQYDNNSDYDTVHITTEQIQTEVNNSDHIGYSGDCATDTAQHVKDADRGVYSFALNHHSAYFAFIAHNDKLPSVKLDSVKLTASLPVAGKFKFSADGIDLNSVKDPSNTITLKTPFFSENGHRHLPRVYGKTAQDSTAAYMVMAPHKNEPITLTCTYYLRDTLSLIDTVYVKTYRMSQLKPNTFYTVNVNVPDTLFSIVPMIPGDIKFSYRNVLAYFERGSINYYGGAFGYGESNTKNTYGGDRNAGPINQEFTPYYDAAYQRWSRNAYGSEVGSMRMMLYNEADSLLKYCDQKWTTFNDVPGVLLTSRYTGKRLFLPVSSSFNHYWTVNRGEDNNKSTQYSLVAEQYHTPDILRRVTTSLITAGYARPVIEYSNELEDGEYAHSLTLLRHKRDTIMPSGEFRTIGILRVPRPWNTNSFASSQQDAGVTVPFSDTGFIFGTDSASLYFDETDENKNYVWYDSLFIKRQMAHADDPDYYPFQDGDHIMCSAGSKGVGAYANREQEIVYNFSSKYFLGYLNKKKKYFVREYFVYNGKRYYATRATQLTGYVPHTDKITYRPGDETAIFNGRIAGISAEVIGKVGFLVTDSIIEDKNGNANYALPRMRLKYKNRKVILSEGTINNTVVRGEVEKDMTFHYTLTDLDPERYYFVRACIFTIGTKEDGITPDTTVIYADSAETRILKPLKMIDLGLPSGARWASLDLNGQFPEEHDEGAQWNSHYFRDPKDNYWKPYPMDDVVTDIAGTDYDATYGLWHVNKGWLYTMPTAEQYTELALYGVVEKVIRFGLVAAKITGPNGNIFYLPAIETPDIPFHTWEWTSSRPWTHTANRAYMGNAVATSSPIGTDETTATHWLRPIYQTNHKLQTVMQTDETGKDMFIATDTVGINATRDNMLFYGRIDGITPEMYASTEKPIERGFLLHGYCGGTFDDVGPDKGAVMAKADRDDKGALTVEADSINGLYTVELPTAVRDTMRSDRDYWYRAYLKVGTDTIYGKPRKLSPLTIAVKDIKWEVHENFATLISNIQGTVFISNKDKSTTGFVIYKTNNVDSLKAGLGRAGRDIKYNGAADHDGDYSVTMPVPKDTIYWVMAYVTNGDGSARFSAPRQFGLDYVDLGLPSGNLWANISVGSAYPEDSTNYYGLAEYWERNRPIREVNSAYTVGDPYVGAEAKDLTLTSNQGKKTYTIEGYRGAIRNMDKNCSVDQALWKHYFGTKDDAAYVEWENEDERYKTNKDNKYNDYHTYGDLFTTPEFADWQELRDSCTWKKAVENGISGYRLKGPNGNTLFIPYDGVKYFTPSNQTDTLYQRFGAAGFYQMADTTMFATMHDTWNPKKQGFDNGYLGGWGGLSNTHMYGGLSVRPVARYNIRIGNKNPILANDTLVFLRTDTCTYLNYRTAVVLQGSYRINKPRNEGYELCFFVGNDEKVNWQDGRHLFKVTQKLRNASQYFAVLDADDNLETDKTYWYRFCLYDNKTKQYYPAEDVDTFHMGRQLTGMPDWAIYQDKATLHGTVQGLMKDASGASDFDAGIIVSKKRDLKGSDSDLLMKKSLKSQLKNYVGPIETEYTLPGDATYYFRTYTYYNGAYHYGDVNVFGYEMVDLGLPSGKLWANMNVGGTGPNDGITTLADTKVNSYGVEEIAYTTSKGWQHSTVVFSDPALGSPKDPAHMKWYGANRMPYDMEYNELIANCTWTPDTLYGHPGVRVTSKKNGNSIFFRTRANFQWWTYFFDYSSCHHKPANYQNHEGKSPLFLVTYDGPNPKVEGYYDPIVGCRGDVFERPIMQTNFSITHDGHQDPMLIYTDSAIVHPNVDNVTFFGTFLGKWQQHFSDTKSHEVPGIEYVGFVVGTDSLVEHTSKTFRYDFPNKGLDHDSVYYLNTENINFFKIDTTYWARAYVVIDGKYYYANSKKFLRQPNIITGDVEWKVGRQTATLHGNVKGFNDNVDLYNPNNEENATNLKSIDEIAKSARVGILLGYKDNLEFSKADSIAGNVMKYDLGTARSGAFEITVPYAKDTTYYYRAYLYYNGVYRYAKLTNHYGLEFVDLGLPMHWASINVGSRFAEDESDILTWGATKPNASGTYKFGEYEYYNATSDDEYHNLGNEIKGSEYDAPHVRWNYTWDENLYGGRGALWAMPSESDLQMLIDSCEWRDSTSYRYNPETNRHDPVKGYKVVGKTGRSIFLSSERIAEWDMAGYHSYEIGPWDCGPLWSSSRAPRERNAITLEVGSLYKVDPRLRLLQDHYRYHGQWVRPIVYITDSIAIGNKAKHRLSITTERTSWLAGDTTAVIYGCVLGLSQNFGVKANVGFCVANDESKLAAIIKAGTNPSTLTSASGVTTYALASDTYTSGRYSKTLTHLKNDRMYYYAVYATINGKTYYGKMNNFGIVMVDLGLTSGTKWANVNMGAWHSRDHGKFYAWGERNDKDAFSQANYNYYDPTLNSYLNLGTNITANDTLDAAFHNLKLSWRMPTDAQWQELIDECTWKIDTLSHVIGYTITSKANSNSIFLPANYFSDSDPNVGFTYTTNQDGSGYSYKYAHELAAYANYWSGIRGSLGSDGRMTSFSAKDNTTAVADIKRWFGGAIRPVSYTNAGDDSKFYLRTDGTDWRYQRDSVNFYTIATGVPKGYTVGTIINQTLPDINATTPKAQYDLKAGERDGLSGAYVAIRKPCELNDGVYYYRSYVERTSDKKRWYGDVRQFGLKSFTIGGMEWANINVDAASPEEQGLDGTPSGKYAEGDPAYIEFGGLWRMPTAEEKQALVDNSIIVEVPLYGVNMYKFTSSTSPDNAIYLTSKDPSQWGYRAVRQSNMTFADGKSLFLRTDSTSWRVGGLGTSLFATLVGDANVTANVTERGFYLGTSEDVNKDSEGVQRYVTDAKTQTSETGFQATLPSLGFGSYYYRAYVKYKNADGTVEEKAAPNALPVGVEFVDLGLPSGTRWATLNMGAKDTLDVGYRYQWGDTITNKTFTKDSYKYYDNNNGNYADLGADISSNTNYDAAALRLEGTRMPTFTESGELLKNCTFERDASGKFYKVTGKNGKYIIMPASYYWTSTQDGIYPSKAIYYWPSASNWAGIEREKGYLIRPVISPVTTLDATNISTTTAKLNGLVSLGSALSGATVGFQYWVGKGNSKSSVNVAVTADGAYSADVSGLAEGTYYYVRAFATTAAGVTTYGATKNFITKSTETTTPNAVDLGLSVKWADRNIDAKLPEKLGNYYAWGQTTQAGYYTVISYTQKKSGRDEYDVVYDSLGLDITGTNNDVAAMSLSGCWRMPTKAEISELISNCTWTWGTKEGQTGYWVTNGTRSIFLPAGGFKVKYTTYQENVGGFYWSGNIEQLAKSSADLMAFSSSAKPGVGDQGDDFGLPNQHNRYKGLLVRPVYQSSGSLGSNDVFIRTDEVHYNDDFTADTLRGTMLGIDPKTLPQLTRGFVVGKTKDVTTSTADINRSEITKMNGNYYSVLSKSDIQGLNVGQPYYVRAYVTDGTNEPVYGEAVQLDNHTFATDSVHWVLGGEATMYGHISATKSDELVVGFRYWQNADMSDAKTVTAEFNTQGNTNVFSGTMTGVTVGTYYYQAFTQLGDIVFYGNTLTFGAHAVDLGLPSGVKWVDIDLGAGNIKPIGDTYKWGALKAGSEGVALSDSDAIGGLSHDVAHQLLKGNYRMPSIANVQELVDKCTWMWEGNGFRITGPNGKHIFLRSGDYWASQQGTADKTGATTLTVSAYSKDRATALRTALLYIRPTLNPAADKNVGGGGNAGGGTIGGGAEGDD